MNILGGQKIKTLEFELAGKLPPLYMLYWFQKHKDQLWTHMGSAASRKMILDSKYAQNTKKMAIISVHDLFWS